MMDNLKWERSQKEHMAAFTAVPALTFPKEATLNCDHDCSDNDGLFHGAARERVLVENLVDSEVVHFLCLLLG